MPKTPKSTSFFVTAAFYVFLFVVVVFGFQACSSSQKSVGASKDSQQNEAVFFGHLMEGMQALSKREFEKAIRAFEACLQLNPQHPEAAFRLSQTYQLSGQGIPKAIPLAQIAVANNTHSVVWYSLHLAQLYLSLGDLQSALTLIEKETLKMQQALPLFLLADSLYRVEKKWELAEKKWVLFASNAPQDRALAAFMICDLQLLQGKFKQAAASLQVLKQQHTQDGRYWELYLRLQWEMEKQNVDVFNNTLTDLLKQSLLVNEHVLYRYVVEKSAVLSADLYFQYGFLLLSVPEAARYTDLSNAFLAFLQSDTSQQKLLVISEPTRMRLASIADNRLESPLLQLAAGLVSFQTFDMDKAVAYFERSMHGLTGATLQLLFHYYARALWYLQSHEKLDEITRSAVEAFPYSLELTLIRSLGIRSLSAWEEWNLELPYAPAMIAHKEWLTYLQFVAGSQTNSRPVDFFTHTGISARNRATAYYVLSQYKKGIFMETKPIGAMDAVDKHVLTHLWLLYNNKRAESVDMWKQIPKEQADKLRNLPILLQPIPKSN